MRRLKIAWRAIPVLGTALAALCLAPTGAVGGAQAATTGPRAAAVTVSAGSMRAGSLRPGTVRAGSLRPGTVRAGTAAHRAVNRRAIVATLKVTPAALPVGGGEVRVRARVVAARRCRLKALSAAGLDVVYSHNPVDCRSGVFAAHLVIGPNSAPATKRVTFEIVARGASSSGALSFAIEVGSRPTTTAPPGAPSALPTTTLPSGTTTTGPVSVPGGAATTTTTTSTPAGGSSTTTTTAPNPTTTTTSSGVAPATQAPTALTSSSYFSSNWSGYVVTGGPFTAVSGTFTVPTLTAGATGSDNTSAWVGIDGWGNQSLIQAGVDEGVDPQDPQQVDIWPWWEILPATSTPIQDVSVSPGNLVTVTIWQQNADQWEISLVDDSNGQSFTTVQTYTGGGQSAEWIVEAPENGGNQQIYPLAPYSPAVQFSNIGIAGSEQGLDEVTLVQGGVDVSTPQSFSPAGFGVGYTGTGNGAEVPAARQVAELHGTGSMGPLSEG